ncbi:MAG TPA: aspartyl protease family protein [Rhizomicrobium sp.]|nr:aspartyl protease family protein [Rhizomicrobium sp.]
MKRAILALCMLLTAAPAMADDACKLKTVASLPLTVQSNRSFVPISVGGQPLQMLVDTGGLISTISPKTAESLGLELRTMPTSHVRVAGGLDIQYYVRAQNVVIGGLATPNFQFLVQPPRLGEGFNGSIGPDILAAFDADFDFGGGKLNLFSPDHCPGRVTYWTDGDVARLPFTLSETRQIHVNMQLDGKELKVLIDTGASHSVLSLDAASSLFGISEADPALKYIGRVNNKMKGWSYPFKALSFGGITVNNPEIIVTDDETRTNTIGMDVLGKLHMYIAYKERAIYLTPADAH